MTYNSDTYNRLMDRIDEMSDANRYRLLCLLAAAAAGGEPITEDMVDSALNLNRKEQPHV